MISQTLLTELLKLRRSRITWLTWLVLSLMPLVSGLFMWIVMEPDRAMQMGLLGQKAQFAGTTASWESYIGMLLQTIGIGGMILVGVMTAYVYGREYSEGTAKNMLILPVRRSALVGTKLLVVMIWFYVLLLSFLIEAFVIGLLLDLPGYSSTLVLDGLGDLITLSFACFFLASPVAWIAIAGKGYFAPLGFTILMLVLGMTIGATGWGKWFPWSIVPLFAGVAGPRSETLAPGSNLILMITAWLGIAAANLQLRWTDNTQ
ncbi:ABC transporter permease [bacterium]|nr:ABC transporter permease [bacterium]